MISGVYAGHRLEEDYYLPIYEKAEELDVPIYLHPDTVVQPVREYYYGGNWAPQVTMGLSTFCIGWHYDIGVQILRMILSGLFDRLPGLKIMTGHWGEVVSYNMYRMDELPQSATGLKKKISDYFKENVYVNPSGLCYAPQFRFCLDTFRADHIMWGGDYPYRTPENLRIFLEEFELSADEREKIAHGTAEKLLHLD